MPNSKQRRRLTDMLIQEVSLVDRAANGRKFLVFKRESGGEMEELKEILSKIQKAFNGMVDHVTDLEKEVTELKKKMADEYTIMGVDKAGAKFSSGTLSRLRSMRDHLSALLEGTDKDDAVDNKKGTDEKPEDVMKAFNDGMTSVFKTADGKDKITPEMQDSLKEVFKDLLGLNEKK